MTAVVDVIEVGCGISAVGHDMYVIGDADEQQARIEEPSRIGEKYSNREPTQVGDRPLPSVDWKVRGT
ncbi:hypothetical protein PWG15_33765 (plasmid) [Ensifer adhaerens]|uniref:hypothetical protein n=1 Tax=Ensifer adhaerens TaxID=106592 RepID=UPI0023AA0195|nr:hypothetical protein [Ensifer adhaerens]WDZ81871.1 hypothetical protein PWG15_33765 [Ensifer adhaerens]